MPSFGESGGPCLVAADHTSWGIVPQWLHRPALWWRQRSHPQWLSTVCQRHRYRLVLWGPEPTRLGHQGTPQLTQIRACAVCARRCLERVEQKEAEAAAQATAPADVLPESLMDGRMLPSTPADQSVDLCPALRGWTCPTQCAVSVLDSYITSSSRSCGGIGRMSAMLSSPQESTGC